MQPTDDPPAIDLDAIRARRRRIGPYQTGDDRRLTCEDIDALCREVAALRAEVERLREIEGIYEGLCK